MENLNPKGERMVYVDNLRTFLIILVIFFHVALTYGIAVGWYYYEYNSDTLTLLVLTFFVSVTQAFFMALMFAISGYFTPGSYNHKGHLKFLLDRFKKLIVPFILYVVIVIPIIQYQFEVHFNNLNITFFAYYSQTILKFKALGSGPLWFVFVLFVFSIAYTFYRFITRNKKLTSYNDKDFPGSRTILVFIVVLSMVTFLVRIVIPFNRWVSVFNLTYLDLSRFPQYISLFVLGIIGYYNRWFAKIKKSTGAYWTKITLAAIVLWPVMMLSGGILKGNLELFCGGIHWQSFIYSGWESIVCIGMSISLISRFKEKFNYQNNLMRNITASSFTVYLIHTPIIVSIEYLLSNAMIYPLLKFVLVALAGSFICFFIAVGITKFIFMLKGSGHKYFKNHLKI